MFPSVFSFVSFKRENMSIVPGQLCLQLFYRVFREICVKLNIHDNKFLKQASIFDLFLKLQALIKRVAYIIAS